MKRFIAFVPMLILIVLIANAHAWTVNGLAAGAGTAGVTPTGAGSTTPVAVSTCLAAGNRLYVDFEVKGGTLATDGCYLEPAGVSSPCAAANPPPSTTVPYGYFAATGGASQWGHNIINFPSAGGGNILNSEWDAVCTAASMTIMPVWLP